LLYAATPDPLQDNTQPVVQYAELLDTDEQIKQQVISDTSNNDNCRPILTLSVDDDKANVESGDADLSIDDIGLGVGNALVLGVDLYEENDVELIGENVDSECFGSCQRQLIIEQLTETLRVPHGPPGAEGVLASLDDVQLEYLLSGELNAPASDSIVIAEDEILSGSGVYDGDLINYGTISPGNSPGIIEINGDLTIVGGDEGTIDDSGCGHVDADNLRGGCACFCGIKRSLLDRRCGWGWEDRQSGRGFERKWLTRRCTE